MSMEWFRWWHGCITDPKFTVVARSTQQPRAIVIAIWAALLEHASLANPRGSLRRFCREDAAHLLDIEESVIERIYTELERKGLIKESAIAKWAERQPLREDYSTARVRKHREMKRNVTQCNAVKHNWNTDTDTDKETEKDSARSAETAAADFEKTWKDDTLSQAVEILKAHGVEGNLFALVTKWLKDYEESQVLWAIGELATAKNEIKTPVGFVRSKLKPLRKRGEVAL